MMEHSSLVSMERVDELGFGLCVGTGRGGVDESSESESDSMWRMVAFPLNDTERRRDGLRFAGDGAGRTGGLSNAKRACFALLDTAANFATARAVSRGESSAAVPRFSSLSMASCGCFLNR